VSWIVLCREEGDIVIQKWIKETLATVIPNLEWTMDYKTGQDHTGTVYMESPGTPGQDDFGMLFPTYSVEIETSDRKSGNAEKWAWLVYETLNKRMQERVVINGVTFDIIFIQAIPPLPVGFEGQKITYSINLQTTCRKISNTI
jgi:hypothetical protein